ncbi:hypothetical protein [Kingella oralis]|uniref:hypothetical protein n=1 Tax=Kingella oralis TaxID=505 RepID=UPI0034E3885B
MMGVLIVNSSKVAHSTLKMGFAKELRVISFIFAVRIGFSGCLWRVWFKAA